MTGEAVAGRHSTVPDSAAQGADALGTDAPGAEGGRTQPRARPRSQPQAHPRENPQARRAASPRVAVIGAGPRGLTVCERLVALAATRGRPVTIHLVDPYPPGAGRVWRTDQPDELLMNTTIGDQTVFPDASCGLEPIGLGPDMGAWWRAGPDAQRAPGLTADHTAAECSTVFPSRTLYGRYLRDAYATVQEAARATPGVQLLHHAVTATDIVEPSQTDSLQLVRLSDGTTLECTDVVLCVGHIPARLTDERATFARFARSARLGYIPPSLPAEPDLTCAEPDHTVLFRGFGLNFFDLQARLTTGRGGRFVRTDEDDPFSLRYEPSGDEPVLAPSSRRGTPYRCKPVTANHGMPDYHLTFFTAQAVDGLGGDLRFNSQLWPLILADLRVAWYEALRNRVPTAITCPPDQLRTRVATAIADPGSWPPFEAAFVSKPAHRLDLTALARPLEGHGFADIAACDAAVLDFLERDLTDAVAGCDTAGSKAAFAVLWAARDRLKELVAAGRVNPASYEEELRGWFEGFVAGICDGPPPQRFAELIALARSGLVRFIGPEVRITTSPAGTPGAFIASSPAVPGQVRAQTLVDAASPANSVRLAGDPLIAPMLKSGKLMAAEVVAGPPRHVARSATGGAPARVTIPSSGLRVAGPAHRTVDAQGRVHPHRYVMSIQLSSVQFGLAIAANPGKHARTLCDAHTIAEEILAG